MAADLAVAAPGFRPSSILGFFESLFVGAPASPPDDPAFLEVQQLATRIVPSMLAACSRDDLVSRIDAVVPTEVFRQAKVAILHLALSMGTDPSELPADAGPSERLVAVLGEGPARKLIAGVAPLWYASATANADIFSSMPEDVLEQGAAGAPDAVEAESVPAPVRGLYLDALRADVVALAIIGAVDAETRLEPWLSLALVDTLLECERARLRLLASLPQTAISTEIVPMSERLDLATLAGDQPTPLPAGSVGRDTPVALLRLRTRLAALHGTDQSDRLVRSVQQSVRVEGYDALRDALRLVEPSAAR